MADFRKSNEPRDFKERFEFRLTLRGKDGKSENIICQRYFRINNFNPTCLVSYDLSDTIRNCAKVIDEELKSKTCTFLEHTAPMVFDTEEQMATFFENETNRERMRVGLGIVVTEGGKNFVWSKNGEVAPAPIKFDNGEYSRVLTDDDVVTYKFAFYDNAARDVDGKFVFDKDEQLVMDYSHPREVCSTIWDGYYPKDVRNQIDLSNRRGRFEGDDLTRLSFDQYVLYKMVEGRSDLVYGLVKDICSVCCQDNNWYSIVEGFKAFESTKNKKN